MLPEDLRGDSLHNEKPDSPEFDDEELISERVVDPREPIPTPFAHPRSANVKPNSAATGESNGLAPASVNGNGHHSGSGSVAVATAVSPRIGYPPVTTTMEEKIRIAKQKGYEGDPCTNCGALMLVRSGACMRCDNCGQTTGCG